MIHSRPCRLPAAALFVLTLATPAAAFYQTTVTEGLLGQNLDGVWFIEQHMMPEFRVRLEREKVGIPFEVAPIDPEQATFTGEFVGGVQISEITDSAVATSHGLFEGDLITQVNQDRLTEGVESYEAALAKGTAALLLSVRRPKLKLSSGDVVKVRYQATQAEVDGQSRIVQETVRWNDLDLDLPFADEIEEARKRSVAWHISDAEFQDLKENWWKIDPRDPATFVKGEHRLVAADSFDSALRLDDNMKGAMFGLISVKTSNPLAGSPGRQISSYGFRRVTPEEISGTYVQAMLANAPFPIALEFKGVFRMRKLADYSDKDTARLLEAKKKEAVEEQENVEVAPDIPEDMQ